MFENVTHNIRILNEMILPLDSRNLKLRTYEAPRLVGEYKGDQLAETFLRHTSYGSCYINYRTIIFLGGKLKWQN